jgi:hypothetical protein
MLLERESMIALYDVFEVSTPSYSYNFYRQCHKIITKTNQIKSLAEIQIWKYNK